MSHSLHGKLQVQTQNMSHSHRGRLQVQTQSMSHSLHGRLQVQTQNMSHSHRGKLQVQTQNMSHSPRGRLQVQTQNLRKCAAERWRQTSTILKIPTVSAVFGDIFQHLLELNLQNSFNSVYNIGKDFHVLCVCGFKCSLSMRGPALAFAQGTERFWGP